MFRWFTLPIFYLIALTTTQAQDAPPLLLQSNTIRATSAATIDGNTLNQRLVPFNGRAYVVLQWDKTPTATAQETLKNAGIQLLQYVPHHAFYASVPYPLSSSAIQALSQQGVKYCYQVAATHKIHPTLTQPPVPPYMVTEHGLWEVNVIPYAQSAIPAMRTWMSAMDIAILPSEIAGRLTIALPAGKLHQVASLPAVQWIEPGDPPAEPENNTAQTLTRSNAINTDYGAGRAYDGTGVTVGLQDDGRLSDHIDYTGRITQNATGNGGDHGDHVGGTIMGAGNLEPLGEGMANGAHLYVRWVYDIVNNMQNHYNNDQVYITSTSYSNGCNAGYTSFTQMHDQQSLDMPRLLHVFSAGNSGSSDCGYGAGAGWGNVTGGHKVGKNVIAVGALNELGTLTNFSSRGPAHDGRIKPDVCAKGLSVYSTVSYGSRYDYFSGTSMSCPNVSGVIAQLYDAYRSNNNGQWPAGALIKAILLNSSDDIGNPGPDYKHGWGQINALRAAKTIEQNRHLNNTVQQGTVRQHALSIPNGTQELRVMVYWPDKVAAVGAAKALVNDIDMTVSTPQGNTMQPWVLNPTPNPALLDANAVRGIDTLNNMEQVTIDNPAPGTYYVNVNGADIPQGPQTYYLVYEIIGNSLEVTYPIGGESLIPGEDVILRWDAGSSAYPFDIEWSADNGSTWQTIATNVISNERQYQWQAPQTVTGQALVRITQNGIQAQSQATFNIIRVPDNLQVLWACGDSIKLKWDSVPQADEYVIYQLGSKYMNPVDTTAKLHHTIRNVSTTQTEWFSVTAINAAGANSRRARAIPKSPGNVACIPYDVQPYPILNPDRGPFGTCMTSSGIQVKVRILNSGVNTVDTIPIAYQLDNNSIVYDTSWTSLPSAEFIDFTFDSSLQSLPPGNYALKVWTTLPNDGMIANDTSISNFNIFASQVFGVPYSQDFDNFSLCSTAWGCEEITCTLSEGWYNAPNITQDDVDWRTHTGGTASGATGPSADHTTGNGNYLYIEGSGNGGSGCTNNSSYLISPCIDLSQTNAPVLSFWYHMDGNGMGSLSVDIYDGEQWLLNKSRFIGEQGNLWLTDSIDLTGLEGKLIAVRFRGETGNSWTTDMAIDDIAVNTLPTARFTLADSIACPGQTIALNSTSWHADQVQWEISGGTFQFVNGTTAQDPQAQVQLLDQGWYDIRLIATNSLGSDTLDQANAVFTGPHPLALQSNDHDNTICPGTEVTFTASSSASANISQYVWRLNSTIVQQSSSNTFLLQNLNQTSWVIGEGILTSGCATVRDSILVQVSHLTAQAQMTQPVSCNGGADGEATVNALQGFGPYHYQWSTGDTAQTVQGMAAGTYSVTVTDRTGCVANNQVQITAPPPIQVSVSTTAPTCAGDSNGQIILQATGGNGQYTAHWSHGDSGLIVNGLSAGQYNYILTDKKQCTDSGQVVVTAPPAITVHSTQIEDAQCFGQASGSALVSVQNATRPVLWQWSNGATDSFITQVSAGMYFVTATDANGCQGMDTVYIGQPVSDLTIQQQVQQVNCHGDSTGSIHLTAQGGTAPYQYMWDDGTTGQQRQQLAAGIYLVTITDQKQCGAVDTIEVMQPAPLEVQATLLQQVGCHGDSTGAISILATGGTGAYSYQWVDGATGPQRNNLPAGHYVVSTMDSAQCITTDTFTLNAPPPLQWQPGTSHAVICPDTKDGALSVSVSGGTAPYQYQWNTGDTIAQLSGLTAGIYTVTATDSNGCQITQTDTIINHNVSPLQLIPAGDTVLCPGHTIRLAVAGTWDTVQWNNGAQQTGILAGEGSHFATAVDSNGCKATSDTVNYTTHPAPAATVINGVDSTLLQTVDTFTTQGTAGATYQWWTTGGTLQTGQGTAGITVRWNQLGWQSLHLIETTAEGCVGDTITHRVYVDQLTGLHPVSASAIKVYPNPTDGTIFLEDLPENATLIIWSVTGEKLLQVAVANPSTTLSMEAYAQGMYWVQVRWAEGQWTTPVMKK